MNDMYTWFHPGGDKGPPLRISGGGGGGGGYPPLFFANIKVKSKLNPETCYQGIINSWLCYSLLGEALGGFSNAPISRIFPKHF